jgi:membrane associated rhomboid family serine protease
MTLLSRLDRHIGFIAVDHLPIYIVTAQAILYFWCLVNPSQAHLLMLDPIAVRYAGEYWRLLTFLFVTPVQNPLFAFFFLYLLYIYATQLENEWGSFAFTLFYLTGALATLAAGFFFGGYDGAFYLNTTLFLAFAALHPNFELLIFFILPVKIKWLAALAWFYFAYQLVILPSHAKAALIVSLANYFLFFGKAHFVQLQDQIRAYQHRRRFKNWS